MRIVATITIGLLCIGQALAQKVEEPAVIFELGGAAGFSLTQSQSNFGPAAAVEVTPIENWLELEAGTAALLNRHSTEWDTDLLFKKPWTLSRKAEFMAGIGPEWIHTNDRTSPANAFAGEAALDFMFWPRGRHRFGWYLEPAYEYSSARGHEQSLGVTGGLLIGFR